MTLKELVRSIPNLAKLSHPDKIKIFGWYLHTYGGKERFDLSAVRGCYNALDLQPSANLSQELTRLLGRKPRELLKDAAGYRLEARIRDAIDKKYGEHETTVVVAQLLRDLPGKVADHAERVFLSEALTCYRHLAFRATIVMTWNLAYDHLLNWLLKDTKRIADFNANVMARIGAKRAAGLVVVSREDFENLKESEVLDICGTASLLPSRNIKKILDAQLQRRNMAAHPSLIEIARAQADDTVTTLVSNVVLKLV